MRFATGRPRGGDARTLEEWHVSKRSWLTLFMDREGRRRRSRRGRDAGRSLGLESLEGRAVPTVTALAQGALLIVSGDVLDNTITIGRDAAGTILVNDNNGQVTITGRTPTVANTLTIIASGGSGNDTIALDETNGVMPRSRLIGNDGNDVLIGGSGGDVLMVSRVTTSCWAWAARTR